MNGLVVPAEQAEDLDGVIACGSEPVRQAGVELGDLAGSHGDVVVGQDQPHVPGQDPAAEIQKYAALKDQGLITEEEFAAKKKAILGI